MGHEGERAAGRGRGHGAVVLDPDVRGAARRIGAKGALATRDRERSVQRPVAGAQAPQPGTVAAPAPGIRDHVGALREQRPPRVLEVVDAVRPDRRVADAAQVDPHLGVLVAERRCEAHLLEALERAPAVAAGPRSPGLGPHRMRGRAERQHVEHHRLVVATPVVGQETALGGPAVRDRGRAGLRPGPVGAGVERFRDRPDADLGRRRAVEVGLAEQHAGEQQGGVHGRQLDLLEAPAARHVEEVIVEAAISGRGRAGVLRRGPQELERVLHPLGGRGAAHPAALRPDRIGGEPEAHRADARERWGRGAVGRQAGVRVGQVPEPAERALLEAVEERGLGARQRHGGWRGPGRGSGGRRAGGAPARRRAQPCRGRDGRDPCLPAALLHAAGVR